MQEVGRIRRQSRGCFRMNTIAWMHGVRLQDVIGRVEEAKAEDKPKYYIHIHAYIFNKSLA